MNGGGYPACFYSATGSVIVKNEAEHEALEGDWYDSPADVPAPAVVAVERAALIVRAEAAGLKVNGTWGEKRLLAEVEKAEASKAVVDAGGPAA